MNFSQTLKQLRLSKKVTQLELANYLHVSRPTIAGYETKNKQPDYNKLLKLSEFFDVSVDYLLSGKEHDDFLDSHLRIPVRTVKDVTPEQLEHIMIDELKTLNIQSKLDVLTIIRLFKRREIQNKANNSSQK